MYNHSRKIIKTQGLNSQAQIIRELEFWAREKDDRYPAKDGRKGYSYALSQFKDYFFKLQKKRGKPVLLNYWVVAWGGWDFRKVVRFLAHCLNALERFWALGSDILQKFLRVAKKVAYSAKKAVYKARGKELPQKPEPTQNELEEIWAELMADKSAKGNKAAYKNYLINQLAKADKMTVANFNDWLKERQAAQVQAMEAEQKAQAIKNFDWNKLINREFIQDGIAKIITKVKHVAQSYVDVALSDGTTRELDKIVVFAKFGLAA